MIGKGMQAIVDAERNRRSLEKLDNHLPWFGGWASSKSTKEVSKTVSKVRRKGIEIGAKIESALWRRFERSRGSQMPQWVLDSGPSSGTIFKRK